MSVIISPKDPSRLQWQMTLGEFLDEAATSNPDKVYLYFQHQQVTYQQLRKRSRQAVSLFRDMGVAKGDRVCLFSPNNPECLYIWFGLARLGAICVPINTAYKHEEVAYILNDAQPKVLVSHFSLLDVADQARHEYSQLDQLLVIDEGEEEVARYPEWSRFQPMLHDSPIFSGEMGVTSENPSMLVYTSGTTGKPKGVVLTHQMYVAAGQGFATWTGATDQDRFFTCLPFYHANIQYYSIMGSLAARASVSMVERFSASRFWEQIRRYEATVVNFIGMMLPVLIKQPSLVRDPDNSVRLFYGSPAFPPQTLREFEDRFGVRVVIGFALTESCYGTIEPLSQGGERRAGSAGVPRWHPDPRFKNELRIIDDEGSPQQPRKEGEIILRNPTIMPGYWQDPQRTAEALRDGWLYTGDLGWTDEDGYLYFVDRKKDMIRRRGENISSLEVEEVLKRHPAIVDCAVMAVPSDLGEDEVKAYIVPRPGQELSPEEVVYWCADSLAYFKVPRYLEFREDLPRTPTLRVRKDLLRQESKDLTKDCFDREQAGIRLR